LRRGSELFLLPGDGRIIFHDLIACRKWAKIRCIDRAANVSHQRRLPLVRALDSREQLDWKNVGMSGSDDENPQRFSWLQQGGPSGNKEARSIRICRRDRGDV